MPKFPFMVASNQSVGAALTTHNSPQAARNIGWTVNTSNGFRQLIATSPMTFSDMYVQLNTAPGAGTSRTFISRKNRASDNMTLTISDTATVGSDTTKTTVLAAGDEFDIENSFSGAPATSTLRWSIFANSANQVMSATSGGVVSATNYTGVQSLSGGSATLSVVEQVMPTGGKFKNLYAYLGNAGIISGSYDVTLYVNGSPTALTCNLSSANRKNSDTSNSVSVAEGDLVAIEAKPNTPSSNRTVEISVEFEANNPGEGVLLNTTGATAIVHNTKAYAGWYNTVNQFGADPTISQSYALPVTFTKLYAKLGTAPGTGYNRTIALDNNGTDALQLVISDTATSGSVTGHHTPKIGDLLCLSSIKHASAAYSTMKIGLVFQAYNSRSFFNMF